MQAICCLEKYWASVDLFHTFSLNYRHQDECKSQEKLEFNQSKTPQKTAAA